MWKVIVAGTAALAIAGTSLVYAQQRSGRDGAPRSQPNIEDQRWQLNAEDLRAFGEARLAALKASSDPVERLRQRATAMSDTSAALNKLADATDPLYKSLDDSQKRRFAILNRVTGLDRPSFRRHDGDGMRHYWGPRRTDSGQMNMEHSGEQRL